MRRTFDHVLDEHGADGDIALDLELLVVRTAGLQHKGRRVENKGTEVDRAEVALIKAVRSVCVVYERRAWSWSG